MDYIELRNRVQTIAEDSPDEEVLYELYHLNSNLVHLDTGFYQRVEYFNRSELGFELVRRAGKTYSCAVRSPLPPPADLPMPLTEAIERRASVRRFSGSTFDLMRLSTLLKYGNGLLDSRLESGLPRRAIPSGGALYPTEVYVLPLDLHPLPLGAYHYDPYDHALARFLDEPAEPVLASACHTGLALTTASVAIVLSGQFERQAVKYGERSYRFTLLECGHLAQNLLLTASALGLGALPVGGFIDDELNRYLRLDGRREAVLYVILMGTMALPV